MMINIERLTNNEQLYVGDRVRVSEKCEFYSYFNDPRYPDEKWFVIGINADYHTGKLDYTIANGVSRHGWSEPTDGFSREDLDKV